MNRKEQLIQMTARHEALIYETADYIWQHPETGYREWNTSAYLAGRFEKLGYTLVKAGNIPGFYTDLDTGRPGPCIAILGELDSLLVPSHPAADPKTGAVHACGHNAQSANLIGVAAALKEPGALDGMVGKIRLMAVPAEELIELEFRDELRKQGMIKYYGGKVEFIYRGYFEGVDMAMMIHSGKLPAGKMLSIGRGLNGCATKRITYKGVSAHAGGAPEDGKNALYAAACGLGAVNALRETFVDDAHIRFHPIVTQAGLAINAIPDIARMESHIRAADYDSMCRYNEKVNLALAGAAASLGCGLLLDDYPGYLPMTNDDGLADIMTVAMEAVAGCGCVVRDNSWSTGSTDMGDVSSIMPAVHPYAAGVVGAGHGSDYYLDDQRKACLLPAQCLVVAADLLLGNDGAAARKVIAGKKTVFASREEYLAAIDKLVMSKEAVIYHEDGTVTLDYRK